MNHLDPRPRQRDSLADANPRDEETARLAYLLIPRLPAYRQSTTVYDLALHEVPRFTVGAGPLLVLPAASHKDIGAGKWQAGVAGIVSTKSSFGLIAAVITYQHSFSGYGQSEAIRQAAPRAQDMTSRRVQYKNFVDELQKAKNRVKARVRAKVEHPFRILKRIFGFEKVRYRGIQKNHHRLCASFALVNLYLHRKRLAVARA